MHGKERPLISHQAQTSVPHVGFISLCKCDWSFGPTLTPSHWKNTKMVNFSHVQKEQKGQNQVICGNNKQYFFFSSSFDQSISLPVLEVFTCFLIHSHRVLVMVESPFQNKVLEAAD